MAAFAVYLEDRTNTPIDDASVGIFDTNGVPIMSAITDSDGLALFVTGEPEVAVRASKASYYFANNLSISPVANATYTIQGDSVDIAPPLDTHLCRVHGIVRDPLNGELSRRWKIKVSRVGTIGDEHSDVIVTGEADVPHDKGDIVIDLVRNTQYRIGPLPITRYGDTDFEDVSYIDINVPNRPSVKLVDLIAPTAYSLTSDNLNLSVNLNSYITENISLELTDGQTDATTTNYVYAETENGNVSVTINNTSISIRGDLVGNDKIIFYGKRNLSTINGTFYRPSSPTKLLEIEVACVL
jgi:hypothetical protein